MILTRKKCTRLLRKSFSTRLTFILLLISYINPVAFSQRVFRIGPTLAIQGSQLSGDTYQGYNQPGIYAGLVTNWNQNDRLSFQFEVAFSQKGARHNPNPNKGDFTSYDLRLNYIEIPFFFRIKMKSLLLDAGLAFGRLLNYSELDQNGIRQPERPFYRNEFSGLLGACYPINERLLLFVRAGRSLLPVRAHQSSTAFWWNPGQMNSILCFGANFLLNVKNGEK